MISFIVLDGIDGCGKSTQAKLLKDWFENEQNRKVFLTREPGGTEIGKIVREYVMHSKDEKIDDITELLLYSADRTQHVLQIKEKINEGYIVICDRYYYSTIAYQAYGRGISLDIINQLNKISTSGFEPDLAFILNGDVEKCLLRSKSVTTKFDRLESLPLKFHENVSKGYDRIYNNNIVRINCNDDIDTIQQKIRLKNIVRINCNDDIDTIQQKIRLKIVSHENDYLVKLQDLLKTVNNDEILNTNQLLKSLIESEIKHIQVIRTA